MRISSRNTLSAARLWIAENLSRISRAPALLLVFLPFIILLLLVLRLPGRLPLVAPVTLLITFLWPGWLLARLLPGRLGEGIASVLPLSVVLTVVLAIPSVLLTLALGQGLSFFVLLGLGVDGLLVLLVVQRGRKASSEPVRVGRPAFLLRLLLVVATGIVLLVIWQAPRDGDDYTYLGHIRARIDQPSVTSVDPFLGVPERQVGVRMLAHPWLFLQAQAAWLSDMDPVDLNQDLLPLLAGLLVILSFYGLAVDLLPSANWAAGATLLQILFALATVAEHEALGRAFFVRVAQDKMVVWLIILPVLWRLLWRYVHEPSGRWLLSFTLCGLAATFMHPMGFVLTSVGTGAVVLLETLRAKKFVRLRQLLPLAAPLLLFALFALAERLTERFVPFSVSSVDPTMARRLANNEGRLLILSSGIYLSHPGLLLQPWRLIGLVAGLGLWRVWRRQPAARFLLALMWSSLLLIYTPLAVVMGRLISPWLLWRVLWLMPTTLVIVLFVAAVSKRAGDFPAARRRWWLAYVITPVLLAGVLIVQVPGLLASWRFIKESQPLFAADVRHFLTNIRETLPDGSTLLLPRLTSNQAPAFLGRSYVMDFRGSIMLPGRGSDAANFYSMDTLGKAAYETLDRYEVDYIAVRAGEETDDLLQQIPSDFLRLYDGDGWALYQARRGDGSPEELTALAQRAEVMLRLDRPAEAVALYQRVIRLVELQQRPEVVSRLARAYLQVGMTAMAQATLEDWESLSLGTPSGIHVTRALLAEQQGRLSDAAAALLAASSQTPTLFEADMEAEALFDRLLAARGEEQSAFLARVADADAVLRLGWQSEAETLYRQAQAGYEALGYLSRVLGDVARSQGRTDQAVQLHAAAFAAYPTDGDVALQSMYLGYLAQVERISRPNLLADGGFEMGLWPWSGLTSEPETARAEIVQEDAHSGEASLRLDGEQEAAWWMPLSLEAGAPYRFEAMVRMPAADDQTDDAQVRLFEVWSEGQQVLSGMQPVGTGDWEHVQWIVRWPDLDAPLNLALATVQGKGQVWLDDLSIVRLPEPQIVALTLDLMSGAEQAAVPLSLAYQAEGMMEEAARLELGQGVPSPDPVVSRWYRTRAALLPDPTSSEARRLLEVAVAYDGDYAEGWLRLAEANLAGGHLAAAETSYRRSIALDGNLAEAHAGLAQVLTVRQDAATASWERQTALRLQSNHLDDTSSHVALGDLRRDAGDTMSAVATYQRAARLDVRAVTPWLALGDIALAVGGDALTFWWRALAADLTDARSYLALAGEAHSRGEMGIAQAWVVTAVLVEPENEEARAWLRSIQTERVAEALVAADRQPDLSETWAALAAVYWLAGRDDEGDLAASQALARVGSVEEESLVRWRLAQALAEAGNHAGAVTQLRRLVLLGPDTEDAHLSLAQSLLPLGDADGAAAALTQARHFRGDMVNERMLVFGALLSSGDVVGARAALEAAHGIEAGSISFLLTEADTLWLQGDIATAVGIYRSLAVRLVPACPVTGGHLPNSALPSTFRGMLPWVCLVQGRLAQGDGRLDDALHAYVNAVFLEPGWLLARSGFSSALAAWNEAGGTPAAAHLSFLLADGARRGERGDVEGMLRRYRQAAALHPGEANQSLIGAQTALAEDAANRTLTTLREGDAVAAALARADWAIADGQTDVALDALQEAIGRGSNAPSVWLALGDLQQSGGNLSAARLSYQSALTASRGRAKMLPTLALGALALREGDSQQARDQFLSATRLGAYSASWVGLSRAYLLEGRATPALQAAAWALRLDASDVEARLALADALQQAGRLEEAWAQVVEAGRLASASPQPLAAQARLWHALGQDAAAAVRLTQAIPLAATQAEEALLHYTLGQVWQAGGRRDDALAAFTLAAMLDPSLAGAQTARGDLLSSLDRPDEALAAYEAVLLLRPDDEEVRAAVIALLQEPLSFETLAWQTRLHLDMADGLDLGDEARVAQFHREAAWQRAQETVDAGVQLWRLWLLLGDEARAEEVARSLQGLEGEVTRRLPRQGLAAIRWRQQAAFYQKQNRWEDAFSAYEQALQMTPEDAPSAQGLAQVADAWLAASTPPQWEKNRLLNWSFESPLNDNNWQTLSGGSSGIDAGMATHRRRSGWTSSLSADATVGWQQSVRVKPGEAYLLAASVRAVGVEGGQVEALRVLYHVGKELIPETGLTLPEEAGWHRLVRLVIIPDGVRQAAVQPAILRGAGRVWVDDVRLIPLPLSTSALASDLDFLRAEQYRAEGRWEEAALSYARAAVRPDAQEAFLGLQEALAHLNLAEEEVKAEAQLHEVPAQLLSHLAGSNADQATFAWVFDAYLSLGGEVIGGNLLVDGGFEEGGGAWRRYTPGEVRLGVDEADPIAGMGSGLIEASGAGYHGGYFQYVRVMPGETYLYAFTLRAEGSGNLALVTGYWDYEQGGRTVTNQVGTLSGSQAETHVRTLITIPQDAPGAVSFYPVLVSNTGRVWIDDARLVRVPSEWLPGVTLPDE